MDDLKSIIRSPDKSELERYTQQTPGFYQLIKILEKLAGEIAQGRSYVPTQ